MASNSYFDRMQQPGSEPPPMAVRRPRPAFVQHPGQSALFVHPIIGHHYTPGGGLLCECMAICATHVVVKWVRGTEPHVIFRREEFESRFEPCTSAAIQQPDLFT